MPMDQPILPLETFKMKNSEKIQRLEEKIDRLVVLLSRVIKLSYDDLKKYVDEGEPDSQAEFDKLPTIIKSNGRHKGNKAN